GSPAVVEPPAVLASPAAPESPAVRAPAAAPVSSAVSAPPAGSEPVRTWAPAPGQALAPAPARAACSPRPKRPGGALRIDGRQSMDGTCRHLRGRTTQDIDARPRLHARARPGLLRVHGDAPRAPASTLDRVQG